MLRAKFHGGGSRAQPGLCLSQMNVCGGESCIPQVSGVNLRTPASSVRAAFFKKATTFFSLLLGRAVNLSLGSFQVTQLDTVGSAGRGCEEGKGISGSVAQHTGRARVSKTLLQEQLQLGMWGRKVPAPG